MNDTATSSGQPAVLYFPNDLKLHFAAHLSRNVDPSKLVTKE